MQLRLRLQRSPPRGTAWAAVGIWPALTSLKDRHLSTVCERRTSRGSCSLPAVLASWSSRVRAKKDARKTKVHSHTKVRASRRGPVEHCHGSRHCGLASDTRRALPVKIQLYLPKIQPYLPMHHFLLYFLCHQTHADKAASHAHADYAQYRTHARIQRTLDWGNGSLRPSPAPPYLHPWLSAEYLLQEAPEHHRDGSPVSLSA